MFPSCLELTLSCSGYDFVGKALLKVWFELSSILQLEKTKLHCPAVYSPPAAEDGAFLAFIGLGEQVGELRGSPSPIM